MSSHSAAVKGVEILLIEDNPGDIRLTREALDHGGIPCRVNVVGDGDVAMDFLYQRDRYGDAPTPDMIILDLNLPRRSGLEVLAEIKGDPSLQSIPVIVFTSSTSEKEINRSYELHANCFIAKPVGLDRFTEVVQSIERFWLSIVHLPAR